MGEGGWVVFALIEVVLDDVRLYLFGGCFVLSLLFTTYSLLSRARREDII